jgi:hypothetical protein
MSVARAVIARDRATARRERSAAIPELAEVAQFVRERPMTSMMVAAAAGFIFNGGMTSRAGRAVTAFVVPIVLRGLITNAILDFVSADSRSRQVPGTERSK